ncbi:MAG: hypothetical protein PHU46_02950 [Rhodocyclaceae bacterium]|nr:hypothetical protein [Rhodocyclaceae bacterium]
MRLFRAGLGLGILCLALATVAAMAEESVDKPTLLSGEHWTFRRTNLRTGVEMERFREDLLSGVGDSSKVLWTILFSLDKQRQDSVTQEFIDASTMAFYDPKAEGRHVPLLFPLAPGKTWSFKYDYHPQAIFDLSIEQSAEVTGWESVTVPAGTFRTLKVMHRGRYLATYGLFYNWPGYILETYWYAPEVKRVVRMEYQDSQYGGAMYDHWLDELVDYKLLSGR